MRIGGLNFGSPSFSGKLRFDSHAVNQNIAFRKDIPDQAMIKYGFPAGDKNRPTINPPLPMYATPQEPQNNTNFTILPDTPQNNEDKTLTEKLREKFGPKSYIKYAIPGHFND